MWASQGWSRSSNLFVIPDPRRDAGSLRRWAPVRQLRALRGERRYRGHRVDASPVSGWLRRTVRTAGRASRARAWGQWHSIRPCAGEEVVRARRRPCSCAAAEVGLELWDDALGRVALHVLAAPLTHGMSDVGIVCQPADGCGSCRSVVEWEQDARLSPTDEVSVCRGGDERVWGAHAVIRWIGGSWCLRGRLATQHARCTVSVAAVATASRRCRQNSPRRSGGTAPTTVTASPRH